ncbi:glycoside hydrolase family 1 protein [Camillea tinctor]|nr:glycoside hydrolase family 1 protein [Camillea tinctor]
MDLKMPSKIQILLQAGVVFAQQVYIPANETGRPYCTAGPTTTVQPNSSTPSYYFRPFSYTLTETVRTATPVESLPATTYGPAFTDVSHLLPNLSTTSWGNYNPNTSATATDDGVPYGQAAFSSVWAAASLADITSGLYSTTVSPTPVPTKELVYPPPLYFAPHNCYQFPKDFIFGVAGAAAQVEGAAASEGRTPAVPDFFGQTGAAMMPEGAYDTDFTAIENYYLYKQDIERLAAIGMKHYSFSIAWSRVLPFALPGTPVNSQAIEHYDDLINFILEKGMVPMVTLTHFDTPLILIGGTVENLLTRSYYGLFNIGYQNETFQEAFVNYGKLIMAHFADRVPYWITFNEPQFGAISGPSVDNILKSHARLYHFYHDELGGSGQVSIKMGASPVVPQVPTNQSHVEAALHYNRFYIDTWLNPLALGQDYPEDYKMAIQDYVPLTQADLEFLNNTIDFLAVDIYSTSSVYPVVPDLAACAANNDTASNPHYPSCVGTTHTTTTGWLMGPHAEYTTYTTAGYLRTQLQYLWSGFRRPIVVSEFGFALAAGAAETLDDERLDVARSEYYVAALGEMLRSAWEDGVHVAGAVMWSWADNWEWGSFAHRFGLQYVNRTTQERFYRRSFFDAVDFVEARRARE